MRRDEAARDQRVSGSRRRSGLFGLVLAAICAATLTVASPVLADEYDEDSAGHPLRIVAYVLHPVGVAIDYLILRPAHWIVSQEPMKTVFGHED